MRHVFPTSEIAHKWAHQTQEDARNPQGNLYFRGSTIYSYRDSWPLARIYTRKDGRRLVLTNADRYSVTTAQHQSAVNRAAGHLPQIAVPHVDDADQGRHSDNLAYLEKEQARKLEKAGRVMTERGVACLAESAAELHKAMVDYLSFFGIRRKCPPLLSFAAAFERARRIENPDPKALDARERARAARKQAEYARQRLAEIDREIGAPDWRGMAMRTDWRLDGAFNAGLGFWYRDQPPMLRVNGEQIETSQGARIPLAAAPIVWRIYQEAIAAGGREFRHVGRASEVQIGDYPLDRIEADGTLVAGCHRIPASEIRSMARQLGLGGTV